MEIETTSFGYRISLPPSRGKSGYYAFRRKDDGTLELHTVFKSGGFISNRYKKSNGCWIDTNFNYYRIEEGSLEYIALEKLSNIRL